MTESVVLENRRESIARMRQLKELGILISIDDFGTGYSSLAYLRDLPADEVKLDRSFIQTLVHSEQDRAIVKAILDLAQVFRLPSPPKGWKRRRNWPSSKRWDASIIKGFSPVGRSPSRRWSSCLAAGRRTKGVGSIGVYVIKSRPARIVGVVYVCH